MKSQKTNPNHPSNVVYFAGGCFWAPERFFRFIKGVTKFELGYASYKNEHSDFDKVIQEQGDFVETVKVTFDPHKISFGLLLDLFFRTVDPSNEDSATGDPVTHGHTGIFYTSKDQLPIVNMVLEAAAKRYENRLDVEALPLGTFYSAQEYNDKFKGEDHGGYCAQH